MSKVIDDAAEAALRAETKSRARVRYNATLKFLRRVHLYTGLFLVPWVFLYGVTAVLFNHPAWFAEQTSQGFGPGETSGTLLASLPDAATLSREVVAALNASRPGASAGTAYEIVNPDQAEFARDVIALATIDGRPQTVRYDIVTGEGSIRANGANARKPVRAPFATKSAVPLKTPPMDQIKAGLTEVLGRKGLDAGEEITYRAAPELSFQIKADDKVWQASYNLQTGAISGRPAEQGADPLSLRRFLLRLHTAHGYSKDLDARSAWAVAVDLMGFSMVGWGLTGILMWWQMKKLRGIGGVVLVLSVIAAGLVAVGMHSLFGG